VYYDNDNAGGRDFDWLIAEWRRLPSQVQGKVEWKTENPKSVCETIDGGGKGQKNIVAQRGQGSSHSIVPLSTN
jgi:hypothetical protein